MIGNSSRGLVVSDPLFSYVGGDGHNKSDIERSNQRENSWKIHTWCIFHLNVSSHIEMKLKIGDKNPLSKAKKF